MPIPYASSSVAGVAFGLLLSAPAAGFEPMSRAYRSQAAVPANVVILLDSSSSMAMTMMGEQSRLQVAREAVWRLLHQQRNTRFGLFAFNSSSGIGTSRETAGGRLLVEVAGISPGIAGEEHLRRLEQALDALAPDTGTNPDLYTWTPLAETHYEISRYLRGMDSFYNPAQATYSSPLQWRCQPSAALLITDGLPTYDSQFPTSGDQDPAGLLSASGGHFGLPDWDGNADNDANGEPLHQPGSTFYLDDVAAFARDLDLRSGGQDAAGASWDDPLHPRQSLRTHVLGFAIDDVRLRSAALAGGGLYRTVEDTGELGVALTQMISESSEPRLLLSQRLDLTSSDSEVDEALLLQIYQSADGVGGEVQLRTLDAVGAPAQLHWSTEQAYARDAPRGRLQTWRRAAGSAGVLALDGATYAALGREQRQLLEEMATDLLGESADGGQQMLNWLRGEPVAGLRQRQNLLGDPGRYGPVLLPAGAPLNTSADGGYADYLGERAQLGDLLLLGSNDGFLHVVGVGGERLYSYFVAALLPSLRAWAAVDYPASHSHRAGVDGRIALADLRHDGDWHTLAAAGLGAGGRGLIMLRLFAEAPGQTYPEALWEHDASEPEWAALGHVYAAPLFMERAGRDLLLTGNGYGSAAGQAALLVIDALSGELVRQLDLPARPGLGSDNGLSALMLERDSQGRPVAAYGGDLHGQLWQFDLSADDPTDWQIGNQGAPLFRAEPGQPLTAAPVLSYSAAARADLLLIGSGRLLDVSDPGSTEEQAFYAVRRQPAELGQTLSPRDLHAQRLLGGSQSGMRQASGESVDWRFKAGWYLPLSVGERSAERVTSPAMVQGGRVVFTTVTPQGQDPDPCVSTAGGWLMMLTLDDGAMPPHATLDTNRDRRVDDSDPLAAGQVLDIGLPLGLQMTRGHTTEPLPPAGCEGEHYRVAGSAGVTELLAQGQCQLTRIHWRQLQ